MKHNKSYWLGWLQAFADAEGHVDVKGRELVISNTHQTLLIHFQQGLAVFAIDSKLRGPYHHTSIPNAKPIYRLHIARREAVRLWAGLIGFQHPAKKIKLKELVKHLGTANHKNVILPTPYKGTP